MPDDRWLIERNDLAGQGVGHVDAHLLASARLTAASTLWTRDGRLAGAAERLGVDWRDDKGSAR